MLGGEIAVREDGVGRGIVGEQDGRGFEELAGLIEAGQGGVDEVAAGELVVAATEQGDVLGVVVVLGAGRGEAHGVIVGGRRSARTGWKLSNSSSTAWRLSGWSSTTVMLPYSILKWAVRVSGSFSSRLSMTRMIPP